MLIVEHSGTAQVQEATVSAAGIAPELARKDTVMSPILMTPLYTLSPVNIAICPSLCVSRNVCDTPSWGRFTFHLPAPPCVASGLILLQRKALLQHNELFIWQPRYIIIQIE